MNTKKIRLRDFIEDRDGWLYAVSTYDNDPRVGCILRYVPDRAGDRVRITGERYRKMDFDESYALIRKMSSKYLRPEPLEIRIRRGMKRSTPYATVIRDRCV